MSEIDFSGAFPSTSEGGNGQGFAAPASDRDIRNNGGDAAAKEGENEQGFAAPAADGETAQDHEGEGQSTEENARYAAARRAAEKRASIAIEQARRGTEMRAVQLADEKIASAGLIDPYTQKPVRSIRELEEWQQRFTAEAAEHRLNEAGLEPEVIGSLISNHPDVLQAQNAIRALRQQEEQARDAAAKVKIDAQISEIQSYDPNIKSLQDLFDVENFDKISEKVKKGYTLTDAYRLANIGKITKETAAAAEQAALNKANSKNHLDKAGQRGQGAPSVPIGVMASYRQINPNATMKDIHQHYQRYLKAQKG